MPFSNTGDPHPFTCKFRKKSTGKGPLSKDHVYVFFSHNRLKYIVNIHEFKFGISAVKFNLARHSNHKNRYKYLSNQKDRIKILKTVVAIMVSYTKEYDNSASFAFIGSPISGEKAANTKRFRIYKYLSSRYFSPDNYEHKSDIEKSFYAILNKKKNINKLHSDLIHCIENEMMVEFNDNACDPFSENRLNLSVSN